MDTERLRNKAVESNDHVLNGLALSAADEIDWCAAEIARLRAERDASRATAQRALGAAAEANARLDDARKAALTLAEAMARCPEVAALVDAAQPYASTIIQNADYRRQLRQYDAIVAALAAFTPLEPPPE